MLGGYPLDHDISANDEWHTIINRFPTVKEHIGELVTLRPFLRSGRIQITSDSILGPRFILAPHAASFIDPLYSTGIALTLRFVRRLIPKAKEILAVQRSPSIPNPNAHIRNLLMPMEETFNKEVAAIDKIVGGTFSSTHHPSIFRQFWKFWMVCGITSVVYGKDDGNMPLYGAFDERLMKYLAEAHTIVSDYTQKVRKENVNARSPLRVDEAEALRVAAQIKALVDQASSYINSDFSFDLVPTFPVEITGPAILSGGAPSEHLLDYLTGRKRSRILSMLFFLVEYTRMSASYYLGKLLGPRYTYGHVLVELFGNHVPPIKRAGPASVKAALVEGFAKLFRKKNK